MIRTVAINENKELIRDLSVPEVVAGNFLWYWIDFHPTKDEEVEYLRTPLNFHPLAIEDCLHHLQRPKLDYYEDHTFFVVQALNPAGFSREEVDFFLGENYIVSFHYKTSSEIDEVWEKFTQTKNVAYWNPSLILYNILDNMVDNYFPPVYQIEDILNEIDENSQGRSMEVLLEDLFDTRHHLLALRHTVNPMRDLVYRILNSQRLPDILERKEYFADIHDHLLKLSEMIEANRELTTDIRDSYISLNSHQTNHVMKVMTLFTTIFMPLTFIAGVYGMNFKYMPELNFKYGYYVTLSIMFTVGIGMSLWFRKKGWFK